MAAKESDGVAGGAASLPAAQEASLAGQYIEMDINCCVMETEEGEISECIARFASLRTREERLTAIVADLCRMKEQGGSCAPNYIELAAFVLLRESAAAALDGLPTTLAPYPPFD